MKKTIAIVCALALACFAATASAAELYRPNTPETLRNLLGGKSYVAEVTGVESTGEDEDAKFTVSVTICDRDRFDPAVIENLKDHDIIVFGDGTAAVVMEAVSDEFGVTVKGGEGESYSFFKDQDGNYIATTETDNPFYTELFTIKTELPKDISFLDWSDPENLEEPEKKGFDELLSLLHEGTNFAPYNTKLTFDENGKLTEFLYSYSPWN